MAFKSKINTISIPLIGLTAAGLAVWVGASALSGKPFWGSFLTSYLYFVGLSQGILAVAVILRLASAKWSANFFRLATAAAMGFFPVALIMLLAIFLFRGSMFYWVAEADHSFWYNSIFFIARNLALFGAFYAVAWRLSSIGRSATGEASATKGADRSIPANLISLCFYLLLTFVLYQTMMSWDLGMILNRHFADTAYAPLFILGSVYSGAAAIVLLMAFSKKYLGTVSFSERHFINMGQLILGLGIFWVFTWYTQFFSTWFANLPEETGALYLRIFGGYGTIYVSALILAGLIPFVLLIFSRIRNSTTGVTLASAFILVGIWLDRYLISVPPLVLEEKIAPSNILNPGNTLLAVGFAALFVYLILSKIKKSSDILYAHTEELDSEVLIAQPMGWQ